MSDEVTELRQRITDLENILNQFELLTRMADQYRQRQLDDHYQKLDNNKRKDRH